MSSYSSSDRSPGRSPVRALLTEIQFFAILLIVLVAALVTAIAVRFVQESRKWKKFRTLLQEWIEEREQRERS